MRFMSFVSSREGNGPPPQALIDAMQVMAEEAVRAGKLIDTGGLAPLAASTRVRLANGTVIVTDGPFAESKEVVGGYGIVEAASHEEAVEWAVRLMDLHREHWPGWEGEVEVRQIFTEPPR